MPSDVLVLNLTGPAKGPVGLGASAEELRQAFTRGGRQATVWIARKAAALAALADVADARRGDHRLVLLERVNAAREAFLRAIFRSVVSLSGATILPLEELGTALASPYRDRLFIGGIVDHDAGVVVLYRADLGRDPLVVPTAWFTPSGEGHEPDFGKFAIADYGSTVRLGHDYEASADAILYEYDARYRRAAKKELLKQDESFGASLRRLRLQRGLGRDDFAPLSAKQIARIERGETEKPRERTLEVIAERLGVRPEEIEEF
jgi:hypothetical protein